MSEAQEGGRSSIERGIGDHLSSDEESLPVPHKLGLADTSDRETPTAVAALEGPAVKAMGGIKAAAAFSARPTSAHDIPSAGMV